MKKSTIIVLAVIAASFLIGIFLYNSMPEQMASHWNTAGEVDDYMPKFLGLFLMPIISVVLLLLFMFIPKIDPLGKNIEAFRKYYDGFIMLLICFLFYIYIISIAWNLGYRFVMIRVLAPAFTVLFYYIGVLVANAKRNWFIGIRTPWTLSNEKVWKKTHDIGGKLFKAASLVVLLSIFFPDFALWLILVPVLGVAFYTIAYSYFAYQKEKEKS